MKYSVLRRCPFFVMIHAVAYIAYRAPQFSSGTERWAELLKAHTYSVFLYVGDFLQTDCSLCKGVAHVFYEFVSSLFSIQSGTKFNFHRRKQVNINVR
jgi:hypothetical protein